MPNETIIAIGAITAIIITAIIMRIDGWLVFSGCSLIAGLGGYILGRAKK